MKGNLPMARPLKPGQEIKSKRAYLTALTQKDAQVTDALIAAGVTMHQVDRWRDQDAEFDALEKQASLFKDDLLRKRIDAMVEKGNPTIVAAAMKRLPEYNQAKKTEVSVSGQVTHKVLSSMKEEDLDKIILAAARIIDVPYEVVETGDLRLPAPEVKSDETTD